MKAKFSSLFLDFDKDEKSVLTSILYNQEKSKNSKGIPFSLKNSGSLLHPVNISPWFLWKGIFLIVDNYARCRTYILTSIYIK